MSLANDYRRQAGWRDWKTAFDALPPLLGKTVLDLGCAVGDQSAELVRRGAFVIGLDGNQDLLRVARSRGLGGAEFHHHDLHTLPPLEGQVHGIWASFLAAYFVDLPSAIRQWAPALEPGGWIALTEIDDLFAHEPLPNETRDRLIRFADESAAAGRYDFRMGRRLRPVLEECGFHVVKELSLADRELAFDGPAAPDVIEAWGSRFDRIGERFASVRDDFLACLVRSDHRSLARVCFTLATLPEPAGRHLR